MNAVQYIRKKHNLSFSKLQHVTRIGKTCLVRMSVGSTRISRQRINAILSSLKDKDTTPYLLEGYLPPLAWEIAKEHPLEFNKKLQSLCKAIIKAK